jgi:hypothetical protein
MRLINFCKLSLPNLRASVADALAITICVLVILLCFPKVEEETVDYDWDISVQNDQTTRISTTTDFLIERVSLFCLHYADKMLSHIKQEYCERDRRRLSSTGDYT